MKKYIDTGEGDGSDFGTETWNVADAFVKIKIFRPMWECDRYEIIALYGIEDINEQVMVEDIPRRRIEALFRYKDALKMIMENVNFIISKPQRVLFDDLRRHLNFIEEILPAIYKEEQNQVTHTTKIIINEEHFRNCLKSLQKIKEDLHIPLNSAGLIFKKTDEMSLKDLMDDIVESG